MNLAPTVDAGSDGLLFDESTKLHSLVITYIDPTQMVTDIAWTATEVGKGDGDILMEASGRFELMVDLSGISPAIDENDTFILEIKPGKRSSLTLERTIPGRVDDVANLRY